jgi:uncharacterized membrane protein YjgN (DUF898 family)
MLRDLDGRNAGKTMNTLISANSAVPMQQGNSPLSAPVPLAAIQTYPVEFSATGSEYFRIWIVNLLLIFVTLGIYLPWAKVRRIKYFYSNTRIDNHALDFHGEPKKMLRGTAIVGVFFLVYSQAAQVAPVAGLVALLALLAIWPVLFRASMKFRLANTSWRGMRFRFADAGPLEPYLCLVPPMALLLIPGLVLSFMSSVTAAKGELNHTRAMAIGVAFLVLTMFLLAVLIPYFFWRLKRYQHNRYAWGTLQSEYRSGAWDTYKVFGTTVLLVMGIGLLFSIAAALMVPAVFLGAKYKLGLGAAFALIPLLIAFALAINIAPRAFFTARMQNLLWSRTGSRYFRFKSELRARSLMGLQFKNYLLIMLTMGLYWPFAVVATKRMQIEAMALKARIDLDTLTDAARKREHDAAGDMAADIFGLDVGM